MDVLAHGVGGRQDLPLTLSQLVIGAAAALVVSFVVLGIAWREPRLDPAAGRPVPGALARVVDAPATTWVLRIVGLAFAAVLVWSFTRPDDTDNPAAGLVYVLFWVGLVPLSLLLGPVWRRLNPLRTLTLWVRPRRELPAGLGYWPAAAGLFAFAWLELVAPERATLPVLLAWLGTYAIVMLVAAGVYGPGWFTKGDAFEVLSDLVGRLAVIGRRPDGTLVWRNPLDGITGLRGAPGLVAVVVVLLGATFFDALTGALFWLRFVQESGLPPVVTGTGGLLAVTGLVALAYTAATRAAGRRGRASAERTPGELAHSIVPIAVGYTVAHYWSLFILEGQRTVALVAGEPDFAVYSGVVTPTGVANLQVTTIVLGHLVGTVLAHDRALRLFPRARAVTGQVPLLGLMVAYTVTGLLLLFTG
ncbi:hypothetical protein [Dactylosporangium fulvum]|uniref:Fenitrothion hydrolase n=1 Tax=Dactylosporangium fulvum TaxID=53359 RepID=A0ABY5W4L6_9ACTN|nr:hypothetical protein [Dactylosporangium fulvum]UWP84925.1 hypothetical protein Dfulv_12120 [Dactylosporangium fulvum]